MLEAGVPFSVVATIMGMEREHYSAHVQAIRAGRNETSGCRS
jgi:hypothetical protein